MKGIFIMKKLISYLRLVIKVIKDAYLAYRIIRLIIEIINEATNYEHKKLRISIWN